MRTFEAMTNKFALPLTVDNGVPLCVAFDFDASGGFAGAFMLLQQLLANAKLLQIHMFFIFVCTTNALSGKYNN